jgi:hypothetical protein
MAKVHAERVDPEVIGPFGVAGGDVARDPFIEAELREQAEGPGEPFLSVPALFSECWKCRRFWNPE